MLNFIVDLIFFDTTNTYFKSGKIYILNEVYAGEGTGRRRFIVAYNPEQAEHDKHVQERNLKCIADELEAMGRLSGKSFQKAKYALPAHRSMGKYLKELKSGKLKVDKAKVKQYEKLHGKYLLNTSDKSLSAEDVGLGYKQLMAVERAFRTLKSTLSLRPVYHTSDERIRSHVLLCWLALLLVRISENGTGMTWTIRHYGCLHQTPFLVPFSVPRDAFFPGIKKSAFLNCIKMIKSAQYKIRYNVYPLDIEGIFKSTGRKDITFSECTLCLKCVENCPE